MGYTHYFTQRRSFTVAEWKTVSADLKAIVSFAQSDMGVPLGGDDFGSDEGSVPVFNSNEIGFNGVGPGAHEMFSINRKRSTNKPRYDGDNPNWNFCKTAYKSYDVVVTACLCYLATATFKTKDGEIVPKSEAFTAASDGDVSDWLAGLKLAKLAVPRVANMLAIPEGVYVSETV